MTCVKKELYNVFFNETISKCLIYYDLEWQMNSLAHLTTLAVLLIVLQVDGLVILLTLSAFDTQETALDSTTMLAHYLYNEPNLYYLL